MIANINELPEGGMGIKLMWKLADEVSYTRTSTHRNCLRMVKTYRQAGVIEPPDRQEDEGVVSHLMDMFNSLNLPKYKSRRKANSEKPLHKIHLQVNTDIKALSKVLNWYDQLQGLPIPENIWMQCQLAIAEGFTNAVRHAHKGLPSETPVELQLTVFSERLEIKIWDYGQPFDLEGKLKELRERDENYRSPADSLHHSLVS